MTTMTSRTPADPSVPARLRRGELLARAAGTAGSVRRPGHAVGLLAAGTAALAAAPVFAQVAGEQVVHGTASFQRQGGLTTITASNNAIINYNSFNVRSNETVRFVQPDSLSRVLNRINSSLPSKIDGTITSNGRIYIVNPAGIYFGKGSMINVGGIYAAAGTITNQDFLRGVDRFTTSPGAQVVNEGVIQAPVIGLIGRQVANFGTLSAPEGAVMMVSGDTVMLGEQWGHLYAKVESTPASGPDAPGSSSGGGSGRQGRFGAGDMYALAVWNKGTVKADSVQVEAARGAVAVSGTIDASNKAPGGTGGTVEVLGQGVSLHDAHIDASGDAAGGQVLIGGNFQGKGPQRNAEKTTVDAGSEIRADATGAGDGGKVVVWSDDLTRFDGRISARAGATAGDGGFVEISSKNELHSNVNVDLAAPKGKAGTVLYDPKFIRIDGSSGGAADGSDDTDASSTQLINDAGSNTLGLVKFDDVGTAPNTGNSAGNPFIVTESEIEGTAANIVLQATETINTSGTFANSDVLLQPNFSLTIQHVNSTNDGAIILNGSANGNALEFRTQGSGTISILGDVSGGHFCNINVPKLTTAGGDILVATKDGSVTLSGAVNAGAGTVRLVGTKSVNSSGNISQSATASINAGALGVQSSGVIDLSTASNDVGTLAMASTGTGTVAFKAANGFTIGSVGVDGGGFFTATTGLTSPSDLTLTVGAAGTVNQTAGGSVVAGKLVLLGSGTFDLTASAANDVDQLQAGDNATVSPVFSATLFDTDGVEIINNTLVSSDLYVRSASGQLTASGTIRVGSHLTLEGDDIDIHTLAPQFLNPGGAGTATIQPSTPGTTVSVATAGGTLAIDQNDLDRLNAFGSLEVGRADGTAVLTYGGTTAFAQNVTFRSGGAGGTIQLLAASDLSTTGNKNITLQAGTGNAGEINQDATATINAGGGALSLTGDVMTLAGAANSIQGTGGVTLQPADPARVIQLGGLDDAAKFSVDTTEFATLKDGFSKIVVGRTNSSAASSISGITASDALVVQTPSAVGATAMDVSGLTANSGVALFTGGTLNVTQAITATNAEITLRSGADITLANNLNAGTAAGTGVVRIVSGGAVTENAGVTISGARLGVRAAGTIDLSAGTNDVGIFAAANSLAASPVSYADASALTIGSVVSETLNGGTTIFSPTVGVSANGGKVVVTSVGGTTITSGVVTQGGDFTLVSGGNVDLSGGVSAGAGTIRVASDGSVTQTSGRIFGNALGVTAKGDISIVQNAAAGNQVGTIALDASGAAAQAKAVYSSGDPAFGVTVGQVSADGLLFAGATGITTRLNGDALVHTQGGIGISQPINAGTGTVRIVSDNAQVGQAGSGTITAGALGVRAKPFGGFPSIDLQLANTTPGSLTSMTFAADAGTGNAIFNLAGRDLVIGTVAADSGAIFTSTTGLTTTGTVRLVLPGGGVTQSARVSAGALGINSADAITLVDANNSLGTVAIDVTNSGQGVKLRSLGDITVGSLPGVGVFALTSGIVTAGDVGLRAAGAIALNESIDVGGSHDVRLVAGTGITQTTTAGKGIVARALGLTASGASNADVKLLNPDNTIATLAGANAGGDLKFINSAALSVGAVTADATVGFSATSGLTSGGDATLEAGGALNITQDVSVLGTLYMVTTSTITQSASTALDAGGVGFAAIGNVDLAQPTNTIGSVAGINQGVNSSVKISSDGALSVVNLPADVDGSFASTAGVQTTDGAVSLSAGAGFNLAENLLTGAGDQLITAGGAVALSHSLITTGNVRIGTTAGITQTTGTVVATSLGVRAGGDVVLLNAGNNVGVFAATTGTSNGSVAYLDANGFDVGSVGAVAGFTAVNGITTTALGTTRLQSGAGLTQSQAITSGGLGVRAAGTIDLSLTNSGTPVNDVATFAATSSNAGSAIVYRDLNALTVGTISGISGFAAITGITTTGGGDALVHSGGPLVLSGDVNVGAGTFRVVSTNGVTGGAAITASALGIRAGGDINLTSLTSDVDTFGALTTAGAVSFHDADDLTIGSVGNSGTFTPGVTGVSGTTLITLQAGAGGGGNLTFAGGTTVAGDALQLIAGNGPGAPATSIVDALTNSPQFRGPGGTGSPSAFTFRQDANVTDSSLPAAAQFGAGTPQAYAIISDDGDVTINTATKVNGTDLTLSGTTVHVPPDLQVRSLTVSGTSTISSVDATGTVSFNSDITFGPNVTIEADEINFGGNVFGTGVLTLKQKTLNRTVNIGSIGSDPLDPINGELDLTALEISRIQNTFSSVVIGRNDATGVLNVLNTVTFKTPVTIRGSHNTTTIAADILTQGQPLTIDDSVIIAGTPRLDTTASGAFPAGANVTITGTTDADAGGRTLTIQGGTGGAISLQGAVGTGAHVGTQALAQLTATGASITLPSAVTTTGPQIYNGAIGFFGSAAALRTGGTSGDDVTFNGTINGASDLSVDVGAAGKATFAGNIGATTALTRLSVTGQSVVGAPTLSIKTTGGTNKVELLGAVNGAGNALTIDTGQFSLGGSVGGTGALGALAVNAPTLIAAGPITISAGPVTFSSTIDSIPSLTGASAPAVTIAAGSNAVTIGGAVGVTTPLGSFTATGSTIGLKAVRTIGAQSYTGATTLGGDLTSSGSGAISVNGAATLAASTVTVRTAGASGDNISFSGPVSGTGDSLVADAGAAGAVSFSTAVGSNANPLATVSATGATIGLTNVTTTSAQTYNGPVSLIGDLVATGPGAITVSGDLTMFNAATTISSGGGSINFLQRVDGSTALTVNSGAGGVLFARSVGSVTPLTSLTATGGLITLAPNAAIVMQASGPIALNGAVDGDASLIANASTFTLTGPAGATTPLKSLTANASSISVNAVRTSGDQVYSGPTSASGAIVASNLRVNANSGLITMGSTVTTSGDQIYDGVTTLSSDVSASRLLFLGDTVLGNASGPSTYVGAQGVRFVKGLWLFGDSIINAGNGQAFFGGTVESAQNITSNPTPTGVAASEQRSLTLISTRTPGLQFTGDPTLNDPAQFSAYVDAPFLFNANVGGAYVGGPAATPAEKSRMLKTLTFSRGSSGSSVSPVATIVMTKGQFNTPDDGEGQPSKNIGDWFPAGGLGGFTIPPGFQAENPALDGSTVRLLTTGGFDMGANNKLLAVGNFYGYVDSGTMTLGDIASLANISLASDDKAGSGIVINNRNPGTIATNQFTKANGAVGDTTLDDAGVDFVALNNISFFTVPTVTGGGRARFSTPPVAGRVTLTVDGVDFFGASTIKGDLERSDFQNANVDRNLLFPADGNAGLTQGQAFSNLTSYGLGLDLRAAGAPDQKNLASALAGALPTANAVQVQQGVTLGGGVVDDLRQLGLQVKELDGGAAAEEATLALSGRTEYNDVPRLSRPDPDPASKDYRVSINRLSADSVRAVLNAYYDLVGADAQVRPERKTQIQDALAASWDKYAIPIENAKGTPDGIGFRRYVESNESEKQTLVYLDKIGVLLRQIDRLALTPVELEQPKQKTLGDLKAELMSPRQLEEAALGEPVK